MTAVPGNNMKKAGKMTGSRQRGFSLMELMVAMAILLVIVGAVFQLLSQSQQRYVATTSAEEVTAMSRDALDQMIREIRLAGYPAPNSYPAGAITAANQQYVAGQFVGGVPPVVGTPFLLGNNYALQFEADVTNDGIVEVIDYQLRRPPSETAGDCSSVPPDASLTTVTLMRSEVPKNPDGSPLTPAQKDFQPFLENVRNCQLSTVLNPMPIFRMCPAPPATLAGCPTMTAMRTSSLAPPANTRIVMIRLQVQTPIRDPQTGQLQNVEQFGLVERVNPD